MDLFKLVAKLGLDTQEYEKGIQKAKESNKDLGSNTESATGKIQSVWSKMFSAVESDGKSKLESLSAWTLAKARLIVDGIKSIFSKIVDLGKSAISAAADVSAEKAQFSATFDGIEEAANGVFASVEKDTGVLATRLQQVGTKAFSQFKGAGIDASSSLSMMDKYTRLAADAAAYYDITLEDADVRLRSFLRGNTEAGDSIGLFTSESQRNAKAVELYGTKWTSLTEAQKQNLMLNVAQEIYDQSGATGQAAREMDGWVNVTGNLQRVWKDVLGVIGTPIYDSLTPVVQKLTDFLSDETVQLRLGIFAEKLGNIAGYVFDGVIDFIDKILAWSNGDEQIKFDIHIPTWDEIKETGETALNTIISGIEGLATWTLGAFTIDGVSLKDITDKFSAWWTSNTLYDKIKALAKWALGTAAMPTLLSITTLFTDFWTKIAMPALEGIAKFALGEIILPFAADIYNKFRNWWNGEDGIAAGIESLTGWKIQLPEMPSIQDMVDAVGDWWESVKQAVGDLTLVVKKSFTSNFYSKDAGGSGMTQEEADRAFLGLPSKATGLDYVPYDDFKANLHAGEAVLNRADATAYREGRTGTGIDYATLGQAVGAAVREALNGIGVNMDGQRVGKITAPIVSREIAREAHARRYVTV